MTPRERRTLWLASLILFLASGARYAYESRTADPLLPSDAAGVGAVLLEGTREARAEEERRSRPLADGERIDPNRAPPEELDRLPGVGPAVADRIVAEREEGGGFRSAGDLDRVRGIGPATVRRLEPHLDFSTPPSASLARTRGSIGTRRSVEDRGAGSAASSGSPQPTGSSARSGLSRLSAPSRLPGLGRSVGSAKATASPPILDLNRATVDELQGLRGVGPVLAERIVLLRREKGRFRTVDELLEVRGVGPATLERLRPRLGLSP